MKAPVFSRRVALCFAIAVFALVAHAQTAQPSVAAHRDLAYSALGHERQRLDLFVPKSATPVPVVVWIHGGGWQTGDKKNSGAGEGFTTRGIAFAKINYRLSQHAPFPAQIEDVKTAIRFLRSRAAEFGIDPRRIGVWGDSAGGHLVSLLGTLDEETFRTNEYADQSSRVQAVVNYYGVSDLAALFAHVNADGSRPAKDPVFKLLAGKPDEKTELYRLGSPLTHVSRDDAAFFILHCTGDPIVPLAQTEALATALEKAGVPVTVKTFPGTFHSGGVFWTKETMGSVVQFFLQRLRIPQ